MANYAGKMSADVIKKTPYGVVSDSQYAEQISFNIGGENEQGKQEFVNLLRSLQSSERAKEQNFINTYCNRISQTDSVFGQQLRAIMSSNFSEAFNIIKLRERGLLADQANLKASVDKFGNMWEQQMNQNLLEIFRKQLTGDQGRQNIKNASLDTLDSAIEKTFEIFQQNLEQESEAVQKQFGQQMTEQFKSLIFQNTAKLFPNMNLRTVSIRELLETNNATKKPSKKAKINGRKTIAKEARSYINRLVLKGMPAEIFINLTAAGTGGIQKSYNGRSGAIQTDSIELATMDAQFDIDATKNLEATLTMAQQDAYATLNAALKELGEDHFIIHTSIKDYNPNAVNITIRGKASIGSRITELQNLQNIVKMGSIEDLIFAIINAANNFVASDELERIADTVASLSAAYMFEDYEESYENAVSGTDNNRLHCYFVNGKYYLLSDILTQMLNRLIGETTDNLVQVELTPSTSAYSLFDSDREYPSWDEVRDNLVSKGTMSIKFQLERLKQILETV